MVEVIKKVEKYRIICERCNSLLKYDDCYDELGENEFLEKVKEAEFERMAKGYVLALPVHHELYIWCPVCKNKVITSKINSITFKKQHLGQRI